MAERLHVQHYHSTGGTKPTASNLKDGEIAVGLKAGEEKLFIKNTTGGVVEFVTKAASDDAYVKSSGATTVGEDNSINLTNGFNFELGGGTAGIDINNNDGISTSTLYTDNSNIRVTDSAVTINTIDTNVVVDNNIFAVTIREDGVDTIHTLSFNDLGNLKVDGKKVLTNAGVTAGSGLTGGGIVSGSTTEVTLNINTGNGIAISNDKVTVKAGTGITVDANGVNISSAYRDDIAKGVSAYTEFNAFMTGVNDKDEIINTLTEIQEYIKNDYDGYISLLNDVTEAKKYNGTITGVTAGKGLTGGGSASTGSTNLTISHSDTSSVATGSTFGPTSSVTGTNGTTVVIPNFKVDEFGHIVSASTITYTSKDTDTHHTGATVVCASSTGKTNASALNKSVHLNFIENNTVRSSHNIKGTGIAAVTADASGNIVVHVPDTNTDSATTENGHYTPSSSASTVSAGSGKYVSGVKLDSKKHVIGVTEGTLPSFTEQYKGTVTSVSVSGANGLTGSGTVTSSGSVTISGVTATSGATGVSKLVTGDLKNKTYVNGEAAAAAHTHSQYMTGLETLHTEVEERETNINIKREEGNTNFSAVSNISVDEYGRVTNCILTNYIITNIDCGTWD